MTGMGMDRCPECQQPIMWTTTMTGARKVVNVGKRMFVSEDGSVRFGWECHGCTIRESEDPVQRLLNAGRKRQ